MRSEFRWEDWARSGALAAIVLLAVGCGSGPGETASPSGPPMSPAASRQESTSNGSPPSVQSLELVPSEPKTGEPVTAVVTAEDPDGDPVTLRFDWSVNGVRRPARGDTLELGSAAKGDRIEVSVVAGDGTSFSEPASVGFRIANAPPRIDALRFQPPGEIRAGRTLTVEPMATDRDGDVLEFEYDWYVNGELAESEGDTFSTNGLSRGDSLQVSVTASDGEAESEEFLSPTLELRNAPPRLGGEPMETDSQAGFVSAVPATDPDGDRMRFRLRSGPEGMEVGRNTGQIRWYPTAEQAGSHEIEIEVDDLHGGVVLHRFSLDVGVDEVPSADAGAAAGPARVAE